MTHCPACGSTAVMRLARLQLWWVCLSCRQLGMEVLTSKQKSR